MDTALLMLGGGIAAGVFGSLLGLGGGVLIVPLLTLGFNLPLRDAVGVSLVCVIVNSGASAPAAPGRRRGRSRGAGETGAA
ncbi:MAG: TSUP family transporter [Chloroflexi bacterium]|nr:TSUP family transporter [Chloroflexota bacterium]